MAPADSGQNVRAAASRSVEPLAEFFVSMAARAIYFAA